MPKDRHFAALYFHPFQLARQVRRGRVRRLSAAWLPRFRRSCAAATPRQLHFFRLFTLHRVSFQLIFLYFFEFVLVFPLGLWYK